MGIDFGDEEFGTMEMRNYDIGIEKSKFVFNISLSYPAKFVGIDEILEKMQSKLSENINEIAIKL